MRRQLPIHVGLVCVCGLALTAVVLVALGSPDQPRPVTAQEPELPEADGAAVLDYILNQNPYTEWGSWPPDRWTDFGGLVPGGPPHGNTVRIFVNDIALEAAAAEEFDGLLPPGSIVVKENYNGSVDDPGDLAALTIMYKVAGYNPDANDWFWVKAAGDGSAIDAEGAPEDCTGCHGQAGNADYMLRYAFGDEPVAIYSEPLPEA
ncbi:MAG: cytochrome P460 family protein, partial [Anaerolineae bacterium]|nr:cytochrome P460 family protein [Anaerolineae bacterium]